MRAAVSTGRNVKLPLTWSKHLAVSTNRVQEWNCPWVFCNINRESRVDLAPVVWQVGIMEELKAYNEGLQKQCIEYGRQKERMEADLQCGDKQSKLGIDLKCTPVPVAEVRVHALSPGSQSSWSRGRWLIMPGLHGRTRCLYRSARCCHGIML
jgi:hypothetical protein